MLFSFPYMVSAVKALQFLLGHRKTIRYVSGGAAGRMTELPVSCDFNISHLMA
jgi:hypothetical protein